MITSATTARAAGHQSNFDQCGLAVAPGMFAFGDTRAGFFGSRRVAADLGLLRVKAFVYLLRQPACSGVR